MLLGHARKDPRVSDVRKNARIIPANPHSMLILADGTTHSCFIIDMSIAGAAVSAELQPPVGTPLAVGACIGRVVRLLPNGFAVKFVERQNRNDLNRLPCCCLPQAVQRRRRFRVIPAAAAWPPERRRSLHTKKAGGLATRRLLNSQYR